MLSQEEAALAMVLEKSKQEAEMEKKQEQLLEMMKQIEIDKPDNWGLKKVEVPVNDEDAMEALGHNMNKAIKKLELQQKLENIKNEEEERKRLLQKHRDLLLESRNAERQHDLMRQTFSSLNNDQKFVEATRGEELEKQKMNMSEKAKEREQKLMNASTSSKFSVIQDNYEGFGDAKQKTILNDDFLGDLKLVDVPDSDDECYL